MFPRALEKKKKKKKNKERLFGAQHNDRWRNGRIWTGYCIEQTKPSYN